MVLGGCQRFPDAVDMPAFSSWTACTKIKAPIQIGAGCQPGLFVQLRQQATPIPTNDLWIAALVIQHDLVLLTRDAHFKHLPQLAQL